MPKLSEIGEKAFLSRMLPLLPIPNALRNGQGQDAALIDIGLDNELLAFKIDRIPFPYAIAKNLAGYELWGKLAVVVNFSDLLAVGAVPSALMLSLILPPTTSVSNAESIIMGASRTAIEYGAFLAGGDTKEGGQAQVVGASFGMVSEEAFWNRNGAKLDDIVAVTGYVGSFAAALLVAESSPGIEESVKNILINPYPAFAEAEILRRNPEWIHACLDLSDGLGTGLTELGAASRIAIDMDIHALPISPLAKEVGMRRNIDANTLALGAGDWGLLVSVKREHWASLHSLFLNEGKLITAIGSTRAGSGIYIDGKLIALPSHEHFRSSMDVPGDYIQKLASFRFPHK